MRRRCRWGLVVSVVALGCAESPPEEAAVVRPVITGEVGLAGGARVRTFSGAAETDKTVSLSFRSGGIITVFDMRVGQEVTKGDLLARLDNVQARLSQEQAVSSLNSARSQMDTAKLALERARSLFEKGSASLSEFESAKNAYRTAEASYQSARRSVDIQREQVRFGYIYAPEAGTIAATFADVDENVAAGTPVAELSAGTDMEIAVGVPESVINDIVSDMEVGVSFPSLAGESFRGRVTEVSPSVNAATSTYPVRITLSDGAERVRAGMAADVQFRFGETGEPSRPVVPASSVGEDGGGRFVFLIEPEADGLYVARKARVEIGPLTTDGFEIVSGVEPGQRIATAGLQTLLDGQQVRLYR